MTNEATQTDTTFTTQWDKLPCHFGAERNIDQPFVQHNTWDVMWSPTPAGKVGVLVVGNLVRFIAMWSWGTRFSTRRALYDWLDHQNL